VSSRDVSGVPRPAPARSPGGGHGRHRRDGHLPGARRAIEPAGAPLARAGPAPRRPRGDPPAERPALVRRSVGGAAVRPVLHAGELAPHRPGGRVHRAGLRRPVGDHVGRPGGEARRHRHRDLAGVRWGRGRLGALRERGGRPARDRPPARTRGRGDVLLLGHHGTPQGDPVPTPRAHRPRGASDPRLQEPDRQRARRHLPVARAPLPHGPDRHVLARAPHRRHHGGHGALASRGVPGRHRALRRHERAVRADDVRAPPEAAGRGAGAVRPVVAAARHPRRRPMPGRDQAADDGVVRADHLGVLRGLRERGLHHHRSGRLARPPGLGGAAPLHHGPHLRRRAPRAPGG
jgi:hypothetical protein